MISHTKLVMFIFNILKGTHFMERVLRAKNHNFISVKSNLLQKENKDLYMMALTLSFFVRILRRVYKQRRKEALEEFEHLPLKKWKNHYPIVLVHGFGGYVPDESLLLGDYFMYASQPEVQGSNVVYQADVSPWASIHDRACELY
jgi:hypothetical protein